MWTAVVSEEVETVTKFPVEAADGLETRLAVTRTVSPPAIVPHPVEVFRTTVAPPSLVTAL